MHQNHLTFLPPKTGGQTAAATTLFLLLSQAASSAHHSFLVEQCRAQRRTPAKTADT